MHNKVGCWVARQQSLMRQRNQDIHVVDREESRLAVDHALVPIIINPIGQGYDITLFEGQLSLILGLEVIERATARLIQRS